MAVLVTLQEVIDQTNQALVDPDHGTFIVTFPRLLVLGGTHSEDHAFCWCQPKLVPHRGHDDALHKSVMD